MLHSGATYGAAGAPEENARGAWGAENRVAARPQAGAARRGHADGALGDRGVRVRVGGGGRAAEGPESVAHLPHSAPDYRSGSASA